MNDPYDPSDDDLRAWAQGDGMWPVEDFDLIVAAIHDRVSLLLELSTSPQREFFVGCLYLVVGDAVRSNFNTTALPDLEFALDHSTEAALSDPAIARWLSDSRRLLAHPDTFNYAPGATEAWRTRQFSAPTTPSCMSQRGC